MSTADWQSTLERLEHDLTATDATPWHPDPELGPLPPHLEDRARALEARPRTRIAAIEAELATVRAQLQATRRIPRPHADIAAYLERDA